MNRLNETCVVTAISLRSRMCPTDDSEKKYCIWSTSLSGSRSLPYVVKTKHSQRQKIPSSPPLLVQKCSLIIRRIPRPASLPSYCTAYGRPNMPKAYSWHAWGRPRPSLNHGERHGSKIGLCNLGLNTSNFNREFQVPFATHCNSSLAEMKLRPLEQRPRTSRQTNFWRHGSWSTNDVATDWWRELLLKNKIVSKPTKFHTHWYIGHRRSA